MEIKVTSCADCPFAYRDGLLFLCKHPEVDWTLYIGWYIGDRKTPSSCPLKQQSITVKLESNDRSNAATN